MEQLSRIKELIKYFKSNYQQYGDIFGAGQFLPSIKEFVPKTEHSNICLFFSSDLILNAWRESVLSYFIALNIKHPCVENYKKTLKNNNLMEESGRKVDKFAGIAKRLFEITKKINPETGIITYPKTLGIELFMYGYEDLFYLLNKDIVDLINDISPSHLLVYDPLDMLSLSLLDKKMGLKTTIEYAIKYIAKNISSDVETNADSTYILQESCILTRWMNITDTLEDLQKSLGLNIIRHPLGKELTVCCGEFIWLLDPTVALNNARERLSSLSHVGGKNIIVLCPHSLYLFTIAMKMYKDTLGDINIIEISEILHRIINP